jgi:hypothetical protein
VQPLKGVPNSDTAGGVQYSNDAGVAHGFHAEDNNNKIQKPIKNNTGLIQQPRDGATRVHAEQPLDGKNSDQPLDGNTRVHAEQPLDGNTLDKPLDGTTREHAEQPLDGKDSDNVHTTVHEQPECLPTSGE